MITMPAISDPTLSAEIESLRPRIPHSTEAYEMAMRSLSRAKVSGRIDLEEASDISSHLTALADDASVLYHACGDQDDVVIESSLCTLTPRQASLMDLISCGATVSELHYLSGVTFRESRKEVAETRRVLGFGSQGHSRLNISRFWLDSPEFHATTREFDAIQALSDYRRKEVNHLAMAIEDSIKEDQVNEGEQKSHSSDGAKFVGGGGVSKARGGKRKDLGNLYVRSSWEANVARYLNWLKGKGEIHEWSYEPETFTFDRIKRGVRSYTPDFRIVDSPGGEPYYWEVKGWDRAPGKTARARMAHYYPDVKITLIDQKAYRKIAKNKGLIPNWEE